MIKKSDKIYIAGWGSNLGGSLSTLNLPIDTNAFQQTTDGNDFYLMVIDDAMSSMMYATYFGGSQSNEHVDGGTSRFDKKGIIYQQNLIGHSSDNKIIQDIENSLVKILDMFINSWYQDNPMKQF